MSNRKRSLDDHRGTRARTAHGRDAKQPAVTAAVPGRVTLFAWHQFVLALIATIAILAAMAVPAIA